MTALYVSQNYLKIDCDKCGKQVFQMREIPIGRPYDVNYPFRVICTECLENKKNSPAAAGSNNKET